MQTRSGQYDTNNVTGLFSGWRPVTPERPCSGLWGIMHVTGLAAKNRPVTLEDICSDFIGEVNMICEKYCDKGVESIIFQTYLIGDH